MIPDLLRRHYLFRLFELCNLVMPGKFINGSSSVAQRNFLPASVIETAPRMRQIKPRRSNWRS